MSLREKSRIAMNARFAIGMLATAPKCWQGREHVCRKLKVVDEAHPVVLSGLSSVVSGAPHLLPEPRLYMLMEIMFVQRGHCIDDVKTRPMKQGVMHPS